MKKIIIAAAVVAGLAAGAETRVGIIGCDTSHVIAFTKLMNVDKDPDCAGFRVTAAHKWGSPDIFSSTNRYPKYIAQLEEMGVVMKPTIADLLKDVDAVLLETCDGRPHYAQALEVFKSGKPVFIDKPVAASLADAIKIAEAGKKLNAKWFCSSSLRYVKNAQDERQVRADSRRGLLDAQPIRGDAERILLVRDPRRRTALHDHGHGVRGGALHGHRDG